MTKKKNKKINNSDKNNKLYIGYTARLLFSIFMFVIFLGLSFFFVYMSLSFTEQISINYSERSNLDYRVYLKTNDFYDKDYLEENMIYVASLIDKVRIYFDYNFNSDDNVNLDFNYKIIGKLLIMDSEGKNSFFEKEYILLDNKKISMDNGNSQVINESIEIDYDHYNYLANKFKTSYGVDVSSNFVIYFILSKDNNEGVITNNDNMMSITIPLSERAVNITMNYEEINNTNNLITENDVGIDNINYVIIAVILFVISIVMIIRVIKLLLLLKNNKSNYDKYINRILLEYDRLIVETSTCPVITGDNVIKVNKFQELLDVRDNLKLPIMYYPIVKSQKCYFYINSEGMIYLNVVKAIDLIDKNKK